MQKQDQQQLFLRKKKLRLVIIVLAAALNFGNSFTANSPAPLQQEIQDHLGIGDSTFNLFYSIKSFSGMIFPFLTPLIYSRVGLRGMLVSTGVFCCIG
jgi:cyanate permease